MKKKLWKPHKMGLGDSGSLCCKLWEDMSWETHGIVLRITNLLVLTE